jgi:hypothetical protein
LPLRIGIEIDTTNEPYGVFGDEASPSGHVIAGAIVIQPGPVVPPAGILIRIVGA